MVAAPVVFLIGTRGMARSDIGCQLMRFGGICYFSISYLILSGGTPQYYRDQSIVKWGFSFVAMIEFFTPSQIFLNAEHLN